MVVKDCMPLLQAKYFWIAAQTPLLNLPPFQVPSDPSEDIALAMQWVPVVKERTKDFWLENDALATVFRDQGYRRCRLNLGMMHAHARILQLYPEEKRTATERWEALEKACFECGIMMQRLAHT